MSEPAFPVEGFVKWLRCIARGGHLFAPTGLCAVCGAPADGANLLDLMREARAGAAPSGNEPAPAPDDAPAPSEPAK